MLTVTRDLPRMHNKNEELNSYSDHCIIAVASQSMIALGFWLFPLFLSLEVVGAVSLE